MMSGFGKSARSSKGSLDDDEGTSPAQFKEKVFDNLRMGDIFKQHVQQHQKEAASSSKNHSSVRHQSKQSVSSLSTVFDTVQCKSIVADYLRTYGLNYSFGIFLQEANLYNDSILQRDGIMRSFGLLNKIGDEKVSAMEVILSAIQGGGLGNGMSSQGNTSAAVAASESKATQTEKVGADVRSLGELSDVEIERMKTSTLTTIEKQETLKLDFFQMLSSRNVEEQMAKYRKDCDTRYRQLLESETHRIREQEISHMRIAEQAIYKEKLVADRLVLEEEYKRKQDTLEQKERKALELCKRKLQQLEKREYDDRSSMVAAQEALNKKEAAFNLHNCLDQEDVKKERERVSRLEDELKMKKREYEEAKSLINTRVEEEIARRDEHMRKEIVHIDFKYREANKHAKEKIHFAKQQQEHSKNLEIQMQYLTDNNKDLASEVWDLEQIKIQHVKVIQSLRDQVQKQKESMDAQQNLMEHSTQERQKLTEEVRALKDEIAKKNQSIDHRVQDQVTLHAKYTQDMSRYQKEIDETARTNSLKIEFLREQSLNEMIYLKHENKQLREINNAIDEEVSRLRIQIRKIKYKFKEYATQKGIDFVDMIGNGGGDDDNDDDVDEVQKMRNHRNKYLIDESRKESEKTAKNVMVESLSGEDYRYNIDRIFGNYQEFKYRTNRNPDSIGK